MKYLMILSLVLLSGCSSSMELDPKSIVDIQNTKVTMKDSLIKVRCLTQLIELDPKVISEEVGPPCNRDVECIRAWLDNWMLLCEARNKSE